MVQQISDAELEIMKVVWSNVGEPTLFANLTEELAAKGRPWQKNTLITLLNRLINKGFLKAKKIGRRNEYTALVSETEYQTAQTKNLVDKIYEGNAKGLVSNLILGDRYRVWRDGFRRRAGTLPGRLCRCMPHGQ